jgi:hypothetical protein
VIRLPLETERLRIRPFWPTRDAGPLHELWGDAEAMPDTTGLDHLVAVAMPGNIASRRVMEKLGMSLEGSARYREFEVVRYSIERPD